MRFIDVDVMCRIFYAYINDPCFILQCDRDRHIDDIGFTPNYSNDTNDSTLDYDNFGLQVGSKTTTLISLETIYKSAECLIDEIKTKTSSGTSIMCSSHPIYKVIEEDENRIEIEHIVEFDNERRHCVLDLVVPYDSYYHLVTGKVEANIRDGSIIEHPMLCLYHDGQMMTRMWRQVESLFRDNVMGYLSQYRDKDIDSYQN